MRCMFVVILCAASWASAIAEPQYFYGEDQGPGWDGTVRIGSYPNAEAARAAFVAACGYVGVEDLELLPPNSGAPLALNFGGLAATLAGAGTVRFMPTLTYAGTFPTSGNNYWLVDAWTAPFTITFSEPITAIGFYATDVCDFWGTISIDLSNGDSYVLGSATRRVSGGVIFLGVIDAVAPFASVAFVPDTIDHGFLPSADGYGIDDFTIGLNSPIAAQRETWGAVKVQYR